MLTRIYPPGAGAARVAVDEAYSDLQFGAQAPPGRPYTIANMVATVDGRATIGRDTSQLGDAADAALFATLRERVDCVMAGTRTIAIENYNAPARSEEVQSRRRESGMAARPLMAMVTRSGELPVSAPLFSDEDLRVIVFSGAEIDTSGLSAQVDTSEPTEPIEVLRTLREEFGVRSLLLEGGPHINTAFFAAELIDELFLTVAPVLSGEGGEPSIIAGRLPDLQRLHLTGALLGEDHLFLRYRVD